MHDDPEKDLLFRYDKKARTAKLRAEIEKQVSFLRQTTRAGLRHIPRQAVSGRSGPVEGLCMLPCMHGVMLGGMRACNMHTQAKSLRIITVPTPHYTYQEIFSQAMQQTTRSKRLMSVRGGRHARGLLAEDEEASLEEILAYKGMFGLASLRVIHVHCGLIFSVRAVLVVQDAL